MEFLNKNFSAGWLDIVFPYHMKSLSITNEDQEEHIYTTLKFYARRKAFLLWLHHKKFDYLLSPEEKTFRDSCEQKSLQYNLAFKGLSLLMLFQLRLFRRPAGRLWLYDISMLYGGTYTFLYSNIAGINQVYDEKHDELCQRMVHSRKKVNPQHIMDFTSLDDWKCYFYKFDLFCARIF